MQLNKHALSRCAALRDGGELFRTATTRSACGAEVIDCGVAAAGSLEAGRLLAEICLAGLGEVRFVGGRPEVWPGPDVAVVTDQPVAACMASQYAGWRVAEGDFFAMASGPMRAAYGKEDLFDSIGMREKASAAVGVLETAKLPCDAVCKKIADCCGVPPDKLTLLAAPTSSQAGCVQIAARSVETALHKMHELEFDISNIRSGWGVAPLPPVAKDDLAGIGRTNDAVLYGAEVTLWVEGDDAEIEQLGPQIPSCASRDFGRPFIEIFRQYDGDFYKIDPLLFSPAVVTLNNLCSGRSRSWGQTRGDLLKVSFRD